MVGADGKTKREHLEAAYKQTKRKPPELGTDIIPENWQYLWQIFTDLNFTRGMGMAPETIKYQEILAYSSLKGISLRPWEIDVIGRLDRVWMKVRNDG